LCVRAKDAPAWVVQTFVEAACDGSEAEDEAGVDVLRGEAVLAAGAALAAVVGELACAVRDVKHAAVAARVAAEQEAVRVLERVGGLLDGVAL
jgi:hypothetical protein